jgi:hypothetical protein
MTGQRPDNVPGNDGEKDPWEEFDTLPPPVPDRVPGQPGGEPYGFGFRTGVRSARVAVGFAVYTLVLGTVLALAGCVVFVAEEQWLLVALMILIEAVFIFAFTRLVAQARTRSPRNPRLRNRYPEKPA